MSSCKREERLPMNPCRRCGGSTLAISPAFSDTQKGDHLVGHISAYGRCCICGAYGPTGADIAQAIDLWNKTNPKK